MAAIEDCKLWRQQPVKDAYKFNWQMMTENHETNFFQKMTLAKQKGNDGNKAKIFLGLNCVNY